MAKAPTWPFSKPVPKPKPDEEVDVDVVLGVVKVEVHHYFETPLRIDFPLNRVTLTLKEG